MFAEFWKVLDSVPAVQLGKHELEVGVTHVDVVSRCIPLASNVFEDVQQLIEVVWIIKELRRLEEILVVHHCNTYFACTICCSRALASACSSSRIG